MMKSFVFFLLFASYIIPAFASPDDPSDILYLHPRPGSKHVIPSTKIVVRFTDSQINSIHHVNFSVQGLQSGLHKGRTILSADGRTFIFKPDSPFLSGENVEVTIYPGNQNEKYSFTFTIAQNAVKLSESHYTENFADLEAVPENTSEGVRIINGVSVPQDFPELVPTIWTEPEEGVLFMSTPAYILIFENDGTPLFYRKYIGRRIWDVTVQCDTMMSYMVGATAFLLDKQYETIDRYWCDTLKTDPHEFQLLPDGHSLLISIDEKMWDMSQIVPGGKKNALIIGTHVQELDENKEWISQFTCWDNYNITDALHENLTYTTIHFTHINAIDVDYDGNLLISCRNLDEITKVNRETMEVMWRLGGNRNQFEFINDRDQFNYQHDIRAVPGKPGHYALFDNGKFHDPQYSRAVEYRLDTEAMTAEKVWEYRHAPERYSHWMGNTQRLPGGNTIVGWALNILPKISEVTPEGEIVYEANYTSVKTCYRVHRFPWNGKAARPNLVMDNIYSDRVTLLFNQFGDTNIVKYYVYADVEENPAVKIDSTSNPYIHLNYLKNLTTYYFRVTSLDSSGNESDFSDEVTAYIHYTQPGGNIIENGDFSQNLSYWNVEPAHENVANWNIDGNGQFHVHIITSTGVPSDLTLSQDKLMLIQGKTYELSFDGYADDDRLIEIKCMNPDLLIDYSKIGFVQLITVAKRYTFNFTMSDATDDMTHLMFNLAYSTGKIFLDNIMLREVPNAVLQQDENTVPEIFTLFQNYPNPFNASTAVQFNVPYRCSIELALYDVRGRNIRTLNLKIPEKGQYTHNFNFEDLSSGVYFCSLKAHGENNARTYRATIKMAYIK